MKSKISIITPRALALMVLVFMTACSSHAVSSVPDLGPVSDSFRFVGICLVLCAVVIGICYILG